MKIIAIDSIKYEKKEIMVDDEDYNFLIQWKWYVNKYRNNYYVVRSSHNKGNLLSILMHRVILELTDKKDKADHIDGNGLNNQRSNLRKCSNSENMRNVCKRKNTSSKYKGVSWCNERNNWRCQITLNYKNILLGRFKNEIDAALKYNEGAKKYHGEFAKLNIII